MVDIIQVGDLKQQEKKLAKQKASQTEKEIAFKPLYIRHCRFYLVTQLLSIQLTFFILGVLLAFTVYMLTMVQLPVLLPVGLLYISGFLIDGIVAFHVYTQWKRSYYEVSLKSIAYYKQSIFFSRINTYKVEQVIRVRFIQGALGKIFNCGDIEVYDSASTNPVRLLNVPEPNKIRDAIEEAMIQEKRVDTDVVLLNDENKEI